MVADNSHAEFEKQVLRVMAALYKNHPRTVDLGWDITLVPPLDNNDPHFKERAASSEGTILWLSRNNLVKGNLIEGARAAILGAQLSLRAYSILRKQDNAIEDPTLGQAAVRAAAEPGSTEESAVAELIVRRLS
jgi:hypothetical protein